MKEIRDFLASIGRKGGLRSRRALAPAVARQMVKVREARRAFHRFRTSCFWSYRADLKIGEKDIEWVAEQLMKHGNREAWVIGRQLCR